MIVRCIYILSIIDNLIARKTIEYVKYFQKTGEYIFFKKTMLIPL